MPEQCHYCGEDVCETWQCRIERELMRLQRELAAKQAGIVEAIKLAGAL